MHHQIQTKKHCTQDRQKFPDVWCVPFDEQSMRVFRSSIQLTDSELALGLPTSVGAPSVPHVVVCVEHEGGGLVDWFRLILELSFVLSCWQCSSRNWLCCCGGVDGRGCASPWSIGIVDFVSAWGSSFDASLESVLNQSTILCSTFCSTVLFVLSASWRVASGLGCATTSSYESQGSTYLNGSVSLLQEAGLFTNKSSLIVILCSNSVISGGVVC